MEVVNIVLNVHNNDYLEVMKPCGRADGLILTGELIWLGDYGELYDVGKPHVWVSARLPLRSRGASRRLMTYDQLFIDIFFYVNLMKETFAFRSQRPPPPSWMGPSDVQRRTSTMSTSLAHDAT